MNLRSPSPGSILQAGLLQSPERSFSLRVYAEAMAHASLRSGPTCAPQPGHGIDPRVLYYLDIDAAVDTAFSSDCSDSGSSSRSGDIYGDCSNDSMFF